MVSRLRGNDSSGVGWQFRKLTDLCGCVFRKRATSFKQRLLFGTSQALGKQLGKGEKYHLLQPVYGLGLIAEKYDENNLKWYHHYQLYCARSQS